MSNFGSANSHSASNTPHLFSSQEIESIGLLPKFITHLPSKIGHAEFEYLLAKDAVKLPPIFLPNALLHAYMDYVHPLMPLLDIRNFLDIVNSRNGLIGQPSLLLYQAVMVAATAFVDIYGYFPQGLGAV